MVNGNRIDHITNGETTAEAITGYVDGWSDRQEILDQIQGA